jgi:hypothetical protein
MFPFKIIIVYFEMWGEAILDEKRDEIINKLESELKTLETKNLELKSTNRSLIASLSEQKNKVKSLQSDTVEQSNLNDENQQGYLKLQKDYDTLKEDYEKLQMKYNVSQKEIALLKQIINDSKNVSLFGRFLKRKTPDSKPKKDNNRNNKSEK